MTNLAILTETNIHNNQAGRRAFFRIVPVTQRHTADRCHPRPAIDLAPAGLACKRPWMAGRGSCRGGLQRLHRHAMLELTPGMRLTGALLA